MQRRTIRAQLLRLADAMMKGGKKRVRCEGALFDVVKVLDQKDGDWVTSYKLGGSCALGAVYEGLFGTPPLKEAEWGGVQANGGEDEMQERLERKLPVLTLPMEDIEGEDTYEQGVLSDAIISRNDGQSQPRWKIARWLRSLAAKL